MNRAQTGCLLLLFTLAMIGPPTAAAEDFYVARLETGKLAYEEGRARDAIKDFRIAIFGFLDQPLLLTETLARLALAQLSAGMESDARATALRFLDLERKHALYRQTALAARFAADFEAFLVTAVPQPDLGAIPSLAHLAQAMPPELRGRQQEARREEWEEGERKEEPKAASRPAKPAEQPEKMEVPVEVRMAEAPAPSPARLDDRVPLPAGAGDRFTAALVEARAMIDAGRATDAEQMLYRALKAAPARRDVRRAFVEAAVLAGDHASAIAQIPILEPLADAEAATRFYFAVALWESGHHDRARVWMRAAAPHVVRNAWVEWWVRKTE